MNILFIGIGIIGQRHIRNIKSKFKNINFYTLRGNYSKNFYGDNKILKGDPIIKHNLKEINFADINKKFKIDAAFICLPNYLHSKFLKKLFDKKIHVFLEKPGGVNKSDIKILKNIQKNNKRKKIKIMLGYHLRFNPVIQSLKKLIDKKSVGKILNVLSENGEHIADYRPFQKYWKVFHAKKSKGGGVLLNQIHEIDYLLYLFENYKFKLINSINDKFSNIKIDTEDTISSNFIVKSPSGKFLITLLLNSFERPKYRRLKIVGSKATLIADLLKGRIEFFHYKSLNNGLLKSKKILKKTFKFKFKRNDLFKNEVNYFINSIKRNKAIEAKYGLAKSIKVLELTLKIKK